MVLIMWLLVNNFLQKNKTERQRETERTMFVHVLTVVYDPGEVSFQSGSNSGQ